MWPAVAVTELEEAESGETPGKVGGRGGLGTC